MRCQANMPGIHESTEGQASGPDSGATTRRLAQNGELLLPVSHRNLEEHFMRPIITVVLTLLSTLAFSADTTTLVIPKVTKPSAKPGTDDPLQADYDKMWEAYETSIQKARDAVTAALEKRSAKAASTGELELVELWETAKKKLADEGKLDWDTSPKASIEWKKKFPKVPYPRDISDAVRNAGNTVASANEKLDEGYTSLVKAYTKAKNIPRAKELRTEADNLKLKSTKQEQFSDDALKEMLLSQGIWQLDYYSVNFHRRNTVPLQVKSVGSATQPNGTNHAWTLNNGVLEMDGHRFRFNGAMKRWESSTNSSEDPSKNWYLRLGP